MTIEIESLISEDTLESMRNDIEEASFNEVFFVGKVESGICVSAIPLARGNRAAVPSINQMTCYGDIVLHNHPSGDLTPSGADLTIAADLAAKGVGFFIINNEADNIYVVTGPFAEREFLPLEDREMAAILGTGGRISIHLPDYEFRQEQVEMAKEAALAFNNNRIALIEAGTGVGKSLAYLVPSVLWATRNRDRVVVSTNNINLQEQLIGKDIPFLEDALGFGFKYVLVKGRRNYVCLRKAKEIAGEPELFDVHGEIAAILKWTKKTSDGSLSDLGFTPKAETWEQIASEADTCLRLRCACHTECFLNRARRDAASADLLIVNHHLLFADLAVKSVKGSFDEVAVLPPYKRLIIDEAHHIERVATEHFGEVVTNGGFVRQFGRLVSVRDPRKGLLPFVAGKVRRLRIAPGDLPGRIEGVVAEQVRECSTSVVSTFQMLSYFFGGLGGGVEPVLKMRLDERIRGMDGWQELSSEVRECMDRVAGLLRELKRLSADMSTLAEGDETAERDLHPKIVEIKAITGRLYCLLSALEGILFGDGGEAVRWVRLEKPCSGGRCRLSLHLSPIDIGSALGDTLYRNIDTIVMTSATLAVRRNFSCIEERIGLSELPPERRSRKLLDSPFNYMTQVTLAVATDLPEPTDSAFCSVVSGLLPRLIGASGGGTLLLFTSYQLMDMVYGAVQGKAKAMGCSLLKQGTAPRHLLLERFRRDATSVLFGTDSFWDGVDVPGEALRHVVITRLPFDVPDDPVVQSRQEEIEKKGGNPFMDYLLPNAVIKFRQGFGRLIRRKSDSGLVTVLDRRIVTRRYGRVFMDSLPVCPVIREPFQNLTPKVKALVGESMVCDNVNEHA